MIIYSHLPSFLLFCSQSGHIVRQAAGSCAQSAHWAGPLPALIIQLLWPSVHLHSFSVQLPGAICKAAEQEMRLVCRCLTSLEDVLEGATFKSASWSRRVPPRRRARGGSSVGGGVKTELRFSSAFVMDRDITGLQIYLFYGSKANELMRFYGTVKELDLLYFLF